MPADAAAATRTPCTQCEGRGTVERKHRSVLELLVDKDSDAPPRPPEVRHEPCPKCKGAGAWEQRSLPWEPLEGSCAVADDGTVTVAPWSTTARIPVPGGWLVRSVQYHSVNDGGGVGVGLTFVPDPDHAWAPNASPSPRR